MKKVIKLVLVAIVAILCFACGSKTDVDFSIIPVKGANGEYQYIDVAQKGKIAINPQFGEAHIFRDGLALVKTSGKDGKYGYIDKKGKYAIPPNYDYAQNFSENVAWVQLKDQPPMLIDKKGKMLLQIDSLTTAYPFHDGIAAAKIFANGQESFMFIDKKGNPAVTTMEGETINIAITNGIYAFKNKNTADTGKFTTTGKDGKPGFTLAAKSINELDKNRKAGKWGYRNKKGDIVIQEQFDVARLFFDGMAVVVSNGKYGAINEKGEYLLNPQYDMLAYDSDGLFYAMVGKKWGWVNKKGEIVINPQFDDLYPFLGAEIASVKMGSKWAYVDRKGQIVINPQFDAALPFNGDYAMVANNDDKIGFITKKGDFAVPPLYDGTLNDVYEYLYAGIQNALGGYPAYNYEHKNGNFLPYDKLTEKINAYKEAEKAAAEAKMKELLASIESDPSPAIAELEQEAQKWQNDSGYKSNEGTFFSFKVSNKNHGYFIERNWTATSKMKIGNCPDKSVWKMGEDVPPFVYNKVPDKCKSITPKIITDYNYSEGGID